VSAQGTEPIRGLLFEQCGRHACRRCGLPGTGLYHFGTVNLELGIDCVTGKPMDLERLAQVRALVYDAVEEVVVSVASRRSGVASHGFDDTEFVDPEAAKGVP
jgi:hypothetical protein